MSGIDAWRDRTRDSAVLPFERRSPRLLNVLQQGESEYADLLLELELDEDFAQLVRRQGSLWKAELLAPGAEALVRLGEVEAGEAIDALWLSAVGSPSFYESEIDPEDFRLAVARLAEEHGLLDSCFERLDRELEELASNSGPAGPRRLGLEAFRDELVWLTGRADQAGGPPSEGATAEGWLRRARLCVRAGDPDGALRALDHLADASRALAWKTVSRAMRAPGDARFSFSVVQEAFMVMGGLYTMSSSHSHVHSSGRGDWPWIEYGKRLDEQREIEVIRLVALHGLGRSSEAAALEVELVKRGGRRALVREIAAMGSGTLATDMALGLTSELGADGAAEVLIETARVLGRDLRASDEALARLLEELASLELRSAAQAQARALLFIQLGVDQEVVGRALAAALELDPERRPPLHLRGWFELADGDLDAARAWFERAEGLERMDGASERAALAGLAFVREATGELDEARQAARRALARPVEPALLARLRDLARDR